jgi:type IV pilus assembly protein PilC
MAGIDISQFSGKDKIKTVNKNSGGILSILNKDISFSARKMSDKKKVSLYQELGVLLGAGVDIKSALELISQEQVKKKDSILINTVKDKVISGAGLSEALKETKYFSDYEIFSLQIGEETGKNVKILEELSEYYKVKIKHKRQAVSALSYPLIVLTTSVGVLAFMLNVIVPMFSDVFLRFGGQLPYLTRLVISVSDFFKDYFFLVAAFIGSLVVLMNTQKKKLWFRKYGASVLLRIPVLGELIRKIYLARFCHSMHLLISSRIPLIRALQLVKQMINYYPIEVSIGVIEKKIMNGESLSDALSQFPFYHRRMISLIRVGEEVNRLDDFFDKLSKQYVEDIDHQSKILSSMIEPVLIIFLGLIVGVILIAMYLPMFSLSTVF